MAFNPGKSFFELKKKKFHKISRRLVDFELSDLGCQIGVVGFGWSDLGDQIWVVRFGWSDFVCQIKLLSIYNAEPNKIENVLELSKKYFYEKKIEDSLELLFTNFSKFKNKDKEKIKKELLKLIDSLGNNHQMTKTYRRKLSSLLFS